MFRLDEFKKWLEACRDDYRARQHEGDHLHLDTRAAEISSILARLDDFDDGIEMIRTIEPVDIREAILRDQQEGE